MDKHKYLILSNQRWYYYLLKEKGGLLSDDNDALNKFTVCLQSIDIETKKNYKFFTSFPSYTTFIKYIYKYKESDWNYFEIISGDRCQKVYMDIDIKDENKTLEELINIENRLMEYLIESLLVNIPQLRCNDILIFTSHGNVKRSFHIVLSTIAVINNVENNKLINEVVKNCPEDIKKYIDTGLYSTLQQFRLYKSQKCGSGRPKTELDNWKFGKYSGKIQYNLDTELEGDYLKRLKFSYLFSLSCVTFTEKCIVLTPTCERKNDFYVSSNPWSRLYEYNDIILSDNIVENMINLTDISAFKVLKIDHNAVHLKRIKKEGCIVCFREKGKEHENENAKISLNSNNGNVYFVCYRNRLSPKFIGNILNVLIDPNESIDRWMSQYENIIKNYNHKYNHKYNIPIELYEKSKIINDNKIEQKNIFKSNQIENIYRMDNDKNKITNKNTNVNVNVNNVNSNSNIINNEIHYKLPKAKTHLLNSIYTY